MTSDDPDTTDEKNPKKTFEDFVKNTQLAAVLIQECSGESKSNLLFYLAVDKMFSDKSTMLGNSLLVYQKYIKEEAPYKVKLSKELQESFEKEMEPFFSEDNDPEDAKVPKKIFKKAQRKSKKIVLIEFEKFSKTQKYHDLTKKTAIADKIVSNDPLELFSLV